ncbi:hypothetical protein MP228_009778 [Amoeboaphelidium protococcarum]|nr:hypothetical protein MP228_009778 [Amoeboaphelidium protococcarum]
MSYVIIGVVAAILAILGPQLYHVLDKGNVINELSLVNTENCKLRFKDQIQACEDMQVVPANEDFVLLACGNLDQHKLWWPPRNKRNVNSTTFDSLTTDNFYLLNVKTEVLNQVKVVGAPHKLVLHGIHIHQSQSDGGQLQVASINHQLDGSVIDVYNLDLKQAKLTFRFSIQHQLITTPNDVIFLSTQQILVTNDHQSIDSFGWRLFEEFASRPSGNVVACNWSTVDASDVSCTVLLDGIPYPNGILVHSDHLYIASSSLGSVSIHKLHRGKKERQVTVESKPEAVVQVGMCPDNISVDKSGRVLVAGHPKIINYMARSLGLTLPAWLIRLLQPGLRSLPHPGASFKPWSQVVQIFENKDEDLYYNVKYKSTVLFRDDAVDSDIEGSSVAVHSGGKVVIGLLTGKGIGICKNLINN